METLKTVLFDNDGVLFDTEKIVFNCNKEAFKAMGVDYDLADFQETVFLTNKGSSGFMKDRGILSRKAEFEERRDEIWIPRLQAGGHLIDGVKDVLEILRERQYKLGLTTSATREKFLMMSEDCGLFDYFDFHLFREDCTVVKPNPEIYLKALELAGVLPEEALVVEDAPRGIQAAKSAGIKTVAIHNEMIKGLDTSLADFHLDSIAQLPDLIESLK